MTKKSIKTRKAPRYLQFKTMTKDIVLSIRLLHPLNIMSAPLLWGSPPKSIRFNFEFFQIGRAHV